MRGPNVFFEYWGDEAATREALRDGWYFSGDIGTRDPDGYFFIHDRKKNMIISGGENIYPAEVERVLHTHPAVAEAAVIGRPDARWQEVPVAFVVCRARVEAEALKQHVAGELARFKVPRDVVFVDSLPRNALGKVQHFRLREQMNAAAQLARRPYPPPLAGEGRVGVYANRRIRLPRFCLTCSIVHCFGALSGRQRMSLVPWRKRSPLKWS